MKNLRKAEIAAIALTALCLCFTAGYFAGRSSGAHVIIAEPAVMPETTKTSGGQAAAADPKKDVRTADPETTDIPATSADTGSAETGSPEIQKPAADPDKLDINTASAAALESLPGIGRVLAERIVEYREKIGGFKTIAQLKDIDGIGDKKFEAIKELVTVKAA